MFRWLFRRKRKDLLGPAAGLTKATLKVDFDFKAYAARHIFNKLSHSSEYGFYFFPYGYLFRYPKWGTINEMGFRCRENTCEIRERYPNHEIVAVFGGSTGFSTLVPDEQTFSSQLERMLNEDRALAQKIGKPFKVVNLSLPGFVVLQHALAHLLFCWDIKPQVVISHGGWNDLILGQINDRRLISKYCIAYEGVMEAWGRKIHDTADVEIDFDHSDPDSPDFRPVRPVNKPEDVIRSYHVRTEQFRNMAEAGGARFISGFQPWVMSKRVQSAFEQEKIRTYYRYYQFEYENMPILCGMYEDIIDREGLAYVVNLHRRFKELDGSVTHFGDNIHTNEIGERIIAEEYCKAVRRLYS